MSNKYSSANKGDKQSYYKQLSGSDEYPPNRSFRTIYELRLVKGMTDEFFDILEPNITIYGLKGINPNTASKEVLKAIDPAMTDEIVDEIKKRTGVGSESQPFKDANDFWSFLQSRGVRLSVPQEDVPIITSGLYSFRISSIGSFSSVKREIEVIVMDINQASNRLSQVVKDDAKKQNPDAAKDATSGGDPTSTSKGPQAGSPASSTASNPLPKGPPRIVYWTEK